MNKLLMLCLFLLLILSSNIYSLPRFSLRLNDNCAECHVNPTGGGMRNEDGINFGKNVISMISPRDSEFLMSPKISENISIGIDYRSQFLYSGERKRGDFHDMSGSAYLNINASEKIDISARYDFVQGIWEAYAVAKILPNDSYIKAGSFIPYFGIRYDDHTAYTRGGDYGLLFSKGTIQGLIYNPLYVETGIEIGANLSSNALLTASVGKAKFNPIFSSDPTFTTRFEFTPSIDLFNFLIGGSFASTKTKIFDNVTGALNVLPTKLYGGFAGIGFDRFSLMGEYDLADDYLGSGIKSNALMVEAAYQILVGLEAVVRYDKFDPDTNINNDSFSHLIFGFEFFPYSFIELRPQFRINRHETNGEANSFVLQFHFWY